MYDNKKKISKKKISLNSNIFLYNFLIANKNKIKNKIPIDLEPKNFEKNMLVKNLKLGLSKKKYASELLGVKFFKWIK